MGHYLRWLGSPQWRVLAARSWRVSHTRATPYVGRALACWQPRRAALSEAPTVPRTSAAAPLTRPQSSGLGTPRSLVDRGGLIPILMVRTGGLNTFSPVHPTRRSSRAPTAKRSPASSTRRTAVPLLPSSNTIAARTPRRRLSGSACSRLASGKPWGISRVKTVYSPSWTRSVSRATRTGPTGCSRAGSCSSARMITATSSESTTRVANARTRSQPASQPRTRLPCLRRSARPAGSPRR
mmetsp:Transcript_15784/g.38336  ORF Transcript_15784/g.38336 Transcript_15784/m.38336 type:complete len:239 (-) Transcript_15784:4210-4926(-)